MRGLGQHGDRGRSCGGVRASLFRGVAVGDLAGGGRRPLDLRDDRRTPGRGSERADEVPRGRHGQRPSEQHRVVERVSFQLTATIVDKVGEEPHGRSSLVAGHATAR